MSTTTISPVKPVKFSADSTDVRAWLVENGLGINSRGRFSAEQVAAYNAVHKGSSRYLPSVRPSRHVETVSGKDENGKEVTRRVDVTRARKVLADKGIAFGARGRLSKPLLRIAAGLTD